MPCSTGVLDSHPSQANICVEVACSPRGCKFLLGTSVFSQPQETCWEVNWLLFKLSLDCVCVCVCMGDRDLRL